MADSRFPRLEGTQSDVFANFLERWLHYKVNIHPITKSKPIYHVED